MVHLWDALVAAHRCWRTVGQTKQQRVCGDCTPLETSRWELLIRPGWPSASLFLTLEWSTWSPWSMGRRGRVWMTTVLLVLIDVLQNLGIFQSQQIPSQGISQRHCLTRQATEGQAEEALHVSAP